MIDSISTMFASFKKIAPIPLLALGIASGFILFAPSKIIVVLGIELFKNNGQGVLGGVFVFSWAYLLAHLIVKIYGFISDKYNRRKTNKMRIGYLQQLTLQEKEYLRPYIVEGENTVKFRIEEGIVGGLTAKDILYRASTVGDLLDGFDYNMQPWARKHLESHRELLRA